MYTYIYTYTLRLQFTKGTQTRTTGFTKAILFGLRSTLAKLPGLRTQYEIPKFGIRKNYFVKAKICEIGEKTFYHVNKVSLSNLTCNMSIII